METAIDSISPLPPPTSNATPAGTGEDELAEMASSIAEEESKTLYDYNTARIYLQQLITEWVNEEQKTEGHRLTRDVEINIDVLRQSGDIEDDECFIPWRVIDNNIQREMPSYINFLKNSRRIATFKDMLDSSFDTDILEQEFTKGMTYKGWVRPHFKVIDGAMTHGWASIEVVYDERYPLHCGLEYVAHEDLLFAGDAKDIQASSCILRRYRLTPMQLKDWVKNFGFDLKQVNYIIDKYKESRAKDRTIQIFKRLSKFNGAVYVSWFSIEGCTDWLKEPMKLYAGIDEQQTVIKNVPTPTPVVNEQGIQLGTQMQDVPTPTQQWVATDLSNYPIFILPYRETEKPQLFDYIGRVFLDKDVQEAQTAIISAFINRLNRSAKVFGSPAADVVNDGRPAKQLSKIQMLDLTFWDKPMQFWCMPPPEFETLKSMQYLDNSNSQSIGETDFAVMNRQDSRKTAKEITAAEQAKSLLTGVDLTLYSEFVREVYSFAWQIVRSQAIQNKIKFLLIENPIIKQMQGIQQQLPNAGSIVNIDGSLQQEQSPMYVNDIDTISRYYDVRAAGDTDVIQKQELVQQMQRDWPVLQQTPLAGQFLMDYVRLVYPQDGAVYAEIMKNAGNDAKSQVIKALGSLLQNVLNMPDVKQHITPEMGQQLQQMQQAAANALKMP